METYEIAGFRLIGRSVAGHGTSLIFPELDFSFDVAQGSSKYFMSVNNFLITHGHMDHAAGIPFIISQKSLNHMTGPVFYMPESLVTPMTEITKLWMKIEEHEYPFKFVGVREDQDYPLKGEYFFRVFPTVHRVQSYGYTVFRRVRKLKAAYRELGRDAIVALREKGEAIHDFIEEPLISFTGDTQIEFIRSRPWVLKSKVLFFETTYLNEKKSVSEARKWGHIHLDEVIPHLDEFKNEKIVLIHFSRRHSREEIREILRRKIPPAHQERVIPLIPG
ncbi:MAG TPA: MBL fold metallo-hydrolase [Bdellovibrionales bacterium]|nr:MBL fold metallo-hydrolase [Bdellovibrionales bacterium]